MTLKFESAYSGGDYTLDVTLDDPERVDQRPVALFKISDHVFRTTNNVAVSAEDAGALRAALDTWLGQVATVEAARAEAVTR